MNEHDDAYVDAMLMVNMQANNRSVTPDNTGIMAVRLLGPRYDRAIEAYSW